jgi:hypothetical protein
MKNTTRKKRTRKPDGLTPAAAAAPAKAKQKSKKALLLAAISKPEGITIGQAAKLTGWLENSCRGALSTLKAESFVPAEGQGRRYRLRGAQKGV